MNLIPSILLFSFCWTCVAVGQSVPTAANSVVGCYDLRTLKWKPALEDDPHLLFFPSQVRLAIQQESDKTRMTVTSVPQRKDRELQERNWFWELERKNLKLSLGGAFGGYKGTLKPTRDGQYSGHLKEWCDHQCAYKRTTVSVILSRIDCSK